MRPKVITVPFIIRLFSLAFFLLVAGASRSQSRDSLMPRADSTAVLADSAAVVRDSADSSIKSAADKVSSRFAKDVISAYSETRKLPLPVATAIKERGNRKSDYLFYIVLFAGLLLGVLKISFAPYFNNLFRVFFNTSLRQKQLTDQLLQSLWPSLLFNIFFFISGGIYIYLVMGYYGKLDSARDFDLLLLFTGVLFLVYLIKFFWLKFIGWVSGMPEDFNNNVFIVYLVNKIMGILLLPFLPVIAFSDRRVASVAVLVSFILAGFMLVVRFLRSYSLAAARLRIPVLHFFLYVISMELLPLLILFKVAVLLLNKNL